MKDLEKVIEDLTGHDDLDLSNEFIEAHQDMLDQIAKTGDSKAIA
jgi:hypothetical protein